MFLNFLKFFAVSFLLTGCSRAGPSGLFSDGKIPVSVEKVFAQEKEATLSFSATLVPGEKAEIQFPMDVKIERVAVNLGDMVNQGDPLFYLSEQEFALKLAQLKAQRLEQEALLEKNNYFFKNRDRLLEEGKIDKSMHEALEAEVKTSEAQVEKLKADVSLVENQVRQLAFNAPFSGMVTAKNIVGGNHIPARQLLLTLVKPDPIHVTFSVPQADASSVTKGMNVNVKVEDFSGQNFAASVFFIGLELDSATRAFEVKALLPNPKHVFKGGMSAQVDFVSPRKVRVLEVSSKAVLTDGNREYVYVVRQNRAWRVRIYTRKNPNSPERAEILDGLLESDIVVTEGQEKLKEGSEVNLWR